jgi:phage baseplate assembly protein gpV
MIDRNTEIQDPEELQRTIFETLQASLWTAIPCIVDSVNLEKQTITAVPAIKAKVSDKDGKVSDVELPLLINIPLMFPRAGGFALTFPIVKDDEVLVIFASRCIDSWWQQGGIQVQAELRMHDLSDGFAILAPTSQPKVLPNVSADNVQLRNEDGDVYFEIAANNAMELHQSANSFIKIGEAGNITLKAPTITLDGDVTVNGSFDIPFAGGNNITHWTKNIGATHVHINSGGTGDGGVVK